MKRRTKRWPEDAAHDVAGPIEVRAKAVAGISRTSFAELRASPLGNLLLEDATAAKQHGRMTARIGVLDDGNPIVYSTDPIARDAIVKAIQERTHVRVMNIPEVSEADFAKLLRDGVGALPAADTSRATMAVDEQPAPEHHVRLLAAREDGGLARRARRGTRDE